MEGKKYRVNTWLNKTTPTQTEVIYGDDMTQPGQAMSPKEIMERFASGRPIPQMEGHYYDDDLPDLRTLDIFELQEFKNANLQDIAELEAEIKRRSKKTPSSNAEQQRSESDEPAKRSDKGDPDSDAGAPAK